MALEFRVDLRSRTDASEPRPTVENCGTTARYTEKMWANLKAMPVSLFHVLCVSVKFPWKRERSREWGRADFKQPNLCRTGSGWNHLCSTIYFALRITLLSLLKMVRLLPSLMVPPIWPGLCSGMSITCRGETTSLRCCFLNYKLNKTRTF